jgi:Fe-S cluster assembly iron-binding protein IscA
MIDVNQEALQAMKEFLAEKNLQKPIRIHLQSTGCCDASLGLTVDDARPDDIIQDVCGISFLISPDVSELTGHITISYRSDKLNTGFMLTSEKPVSEWAGFGICSIKG